MMNITNLVSRVSSHLGFSNSVPPMPKSVTKKQVTTLSMSNPQSSWKMPDTKKIQEELTTNLKNITKFLTYGVIFNQVMHGLDPLFAIRFEFFSKFFDGVFILWISCFQFVLKIIPSLANGTFFEMATEFYTKFGLLISKGFEWIANSPM